jgi:catechol 2,3-dioxygenase-like lactoylglutathione lyase family enzyme
MALETLPAILGVDATYYMTKDLGAAVAFYDALLGMKPTAHAPEMFAEYTLADDASFGLYQSGAFYPGGTIMFRVDDVAAFVAAARDNGLTCFGDGHIEDTPSCYMAFGTDPDGNQFIVHKKK